MNCAFSCPPCKKPCEYRCRHSRCGKNCCEPCVDCIVRFLYFALVINFSSNVIVLMNRNLVVGNANITRVHSNVLKIATGHVVMNLVGNVFRAAIHALGSVVKYALLFAVCAIKISLRIHSLWQRIASQEHECFIAEGNRLDLIRSFFLLKSSSSIYNRNSLIIEEDRKVEELLMKNVKPLKDQEIAMIKDILRKMGQKQNQYFKTLTISKHHVSEEVANKSCLDIAKH